MTATQQGLHFSLAKPASRGLENYRGDHVLVADMIPAGAKVLDVGCGDGELLKLLGERRGVDGRGIELSLSLIHI